MSSKLRVYEVARTLEIENKDLVSALLSIGVSDVKNHMSVITPEQLERVKRHLKGDSAEAGSTGGGDRIRPTVIKRKSRRDDETGETTTVEERIAPTVIKRGSPNESARLQDSAVAKASQVAAPAAKADASEVAAKAAAVVDEAPKAVKPGPARRLARDPSIEPPAPAPEEVVDRVAAIPPVPAAPKVTASPNSVDVDSAPAPAPAPAGNDADADAVAVEAAPQRKILGSTHPKPGPAVAKRITTPIAATPAAGAPGAKPGPGRASLPPRETLTPKTGIDVWEGRPGVPMPQARPAPRRVQYDTRPGGGGGARPGGGPGGRPPIGRNGRPIFPGRRGQPPMRTKGSSAGTKERGADKKFIRIDGSVGLQILAGKMGLKATELLMKLMRLGVTGININSTLDLDTASVVAGEFGWSIEDVAVSDDERLSIAQGVSDEDAEEEGYLEARPPVVTVMGHVDHGKTSLLDRIRTTSVADGEAGGITQHIGAYSVHTEDGDITFLDTPGHAAFTSMRQRGAQVTDVVILVVAADDGVMPQTREAVKHAREAGVPIVVAVNKIDKEGANAERVRRELSDLNLVPEEWGGDTQFIEVSAKAGTGIDTLLKAVLLQSEMLQLGANPDKPAIGSVIEAKLDRGRGPVATVLVLEGTLNKGDVVLVGAAWGKVRMMLDENGKEMTVAGPSTPVEIIGLSEVPSAGDQLHVVTDIKVAQEIAEERRQRERHSMAPQSARMSMDDFARRLSESEQLDFKVVVKADVQGSVEALVQALEELSCKKVRVSVVHSGVGAVTEGDINLASAGTVKAHVVGFNSRPAGKAREVAQREGVEISHYTIIYEAIDAIRLAMENMLEPTYEEKPTGKAEIRQLFRISRTGVVAGCMVTDGFIKRNAHVRVQRGKKVVWEGKLSSLKRFKDDAKEVREGFDCGLSFDGFNEIEEGDIVLASELIAKRQKLED